MLQKSSHEVYSQCAERNRILGGEWPEHCCLLTSFAIWPLAFSLPSHAHCLFCLLLLSKWELISMLRSQVAIKLYLHRDRRGAFWQITCSHGDCRAVLRLICFLKTKLEIQIFCYRHCVSMPLYTPCLSLFSVCFVGYFHHNAARLTMWAWSQLLLLSDSPWVLDGYMHSEGTFKWLLCVAQSGKQPFHTSSFDLSKKQPS